MSISYVFKSTIPSCTYVFKDGTILEFIGGKAATDNTDHAEEIMKEEIKNVGQGKSKHPFIYVDENEQQIDSEALSPLEALKETLRKEIAEENKVAMNLAPSTSEQGKFAASVSNSKNNIPVGDSNSGANADPVKTISVADMVAAAKSK